MKHVVGLFILSAFTLISCEKEEDENELNPGEEYQETLIDEKIDVGNPFFTVTPDTLYKNIYRMAWTGTKLWAITDLQGNGGAAQLLMEIDKTNGNVLQSLTPAKAMWCLDYANGNLWDISTFSAPGEQKFAETFDPNTGSYIGKWNYNGQYDLYYYFTYDGAKYWGETNYDCGGSNCQSLVTYDLQGNIVAENAASYEYEDLVFGGDHFWASRGQGIILKLDKNFQVVRTIKINDYQKFGEVNYANEISMHLEYIDSNLWILDRFNNFYKTGIQ
ncbi:MAG: hypothetical protein EP338_00365 [Bacteroidetes bacterium]|nr:MAG: hypothetical protein EP338_00365 [Bacteroidota bacterium]